MNHSRSLLMTATSCALITSLLGAGTAFANEPSQPQAQEASTVSSSPFRQIAVESTFNFSSDLSSFKIENDYLPNIPVVKNADGTYTTTNYLNSTLYGKLLSSLFPISAIVITPSEMSSNPSSTSLLRISATVDAGGNMKAHLTGRSRERTFTNYYDFDLTFAPGSTQQVVLPTKVREALAKDFGITLNSISVTLTEKQLSTTKQDYGSGTPEFCWTPPAGTAALVDLKNSQGLSRVGDTFIIPSGLFRGRNYRPVDYIELPSTIALKTSKETGLALSGLYFMSNYEYNFAGLGGAVATTENIANESDESKNQHFTALVDATKSSVASPPTKDFSSFTGVVPWATISMRNSSISNPVDISFDPGIVGSLDFGCSTKTPQLVEQGLHLLDDNGKFTGTIQTTQPFTDVSENQLFAFEMNWLAEAGISKGWDDGTYRPLNQIERGAVAAFFYRLAGSPEYTAPSLSKFSDVSTSHQFYKEISWMAEQGITKGWDDGTFRPSDSVNRDAMAAFFYRFAGSPNFVAPADSSFADVDPSNQFYKEISWLAAEKISTGWDDGTYRPVAAVNRDAMATFFFRYYTRTIG